ncbi:RNA helicase [Lysinibacillus sphaericus]|uniref:RNA helicase n=1 Tax=Lysinibacillus sphaericus TaxID=1421 RepID=UPI000C1A4F94|nr:RNA helicase [Lysinibacillus sphaericus]PIJ96862.1 RNA helicase [Lysinibacillus sphaericus]
MINKEKEDTTLIHNGSTNITISLPKLKIGVVMPIGEIDGLSEKHWQDVLDIIKASIETIKDYDIKFGIVSESSETVIIQKQIVQGLYNSDVIIVDVSAKNPNVMFELGLRVAFGKPIVIIKDDKTDYSFDTAPIKHISYRRDLRYGDIESFKRQLAYQVLETHKSYQINPENSVYLKSFGEVEIEPVSLEKRQLNEVEIILDAINDIKNNMTIESRITRNKKDSIDIDDSLIILGLKQRIKEWLLENDFSKKSNDTEINQKLFLEMTRELDLPKYFNSSRDAKKIINEVIAEIEIEEILN